MSTDSPSFAAVTLGCRVNQYETQSFREQLISHGFSEKKFDDLCDVYIVNTCAVTGESARKSRQMIRRALNVKQTHPDVFVCVTGCFVQGAYPDAKNDPLFENVDLVCGNPEKEKLASLILEHQKTVALSDLTHRRLYPHLSISSFKNTRAFVKIEDGCDSFCTYCYVPFVRGRAVSRPWREIVSEVSNLAANGFHEIVLTGIETGFYGVGLDEKITLCDLVERLQGTPGLERIRFGSLKPDVFTGEFCKRLARVPEVMPNFHLSLQSGSDSVLSAMGRRYTRRTEEEAIANIYEAFPDAGLSADLICGFPGETEEDFAASSDLVTSSRLLHTHIFPYSPREKTKAASMPDQIPEEIKRDRCARMLEAAKASSLNFARKRKGTAYRILCEKCKDGVAYGYTENFVYTATPVPYPVPVGEFFLSVLTDEIRFSTESMTVSGKFSEIG